MDSEWTEVKERNAKDAVNRYYKDKKVHDFGNKDGFTEVKPRAPRREGGYQRRGGDEGGGGYGRGGGHDAAWGGNRRGGNDEGGNHEPRPNRDNRRGGAGTVGKFEGVTNPTGGTDQGELES